MEYIPAKSKGQQIILNDLLIDDAIVDADLGTIYVHRACAFCMPGDIVEVGGKKHEIMDIMDANPSYVKVIY